MAAAAVAAASSAAQQKRPFSALLDSLASSSASSIASVSSSAALPGQTILVVRVLRVQAIDILSYSATDGESGAEDSDGDGNDGHDGVASKVRGERLARCMMVALRAQAERWRSDALDVAAIEEQPGMNVRASFGRGGAGMAHSLKMNNLSYVMLTWLLENAAGVARDVAFRSTKRKELVMSLLDDAVHAGSERRRRLADGDDALDEEERAAAQSSEAAAAAATQERTNTEAAAAAPSERARIEGAKPRAGKRAAAYDARAHDRNKDIAVATLRRCLRAGADGLQLSLCPKPVIARAFAKRLQAPAPVHVRFESDDAVRATIAHGKADDMCDAVWLALAVALERLALVDRPSNAERAQFERALLTKDRAFSDDGVRALAFDVGVRNLAYAVVHVRCVRAT